MARKPRRRKREMVDEEWKDWGEKFGKRMEKRGKDFGEEIGQLGEKFGRHMGRRGEEYKSQWFGAFGIVGPLIGSIFGIIALAVGIFVLNFVNLALGSAFISAISGFLFANIYLFFAIFLFGNYRDYFSRRYENFWVVSPITTGISIIIALWIFAWVVNLVSTVPQTQVLASVSSFLLSNLSSLIAIFIVLGYATVIIRRLMWRY
jgi:hypothetical protein